MSAHERERLSAYLDGELPVGERAEVAAHLATCSECTRRLSEMGALDQRARELPLDAPPGYFDTLPGRVRARVEELSPAPRTAPTRRRRTLPTWTWAAAAALILGVVTPLTVVEMRRLEAPETPSLAVEGPRDEPATVGQASRLEGLTADRADDRAAPGALETPQGRTGLRAQEAAAEPEPVFAAAPAAAPPPPAPPQRSGGKAEESLPLPAAKSRPPALEKDTPGFVPAAPLHVEETESLEEQVAAPTSGAHREAATAADALSSRVVAEAAPRGAPGLAQSPAATASPGEAGRRRQAQADKKAVLDEDDDEGSFGGLLRRNVPSDAGGWRQRREAWRDFVAQHPESSRADEARVRVVEAGLQAWRVGGDSADLQLARDDGAAYLARDDAALKPRVRRALESADRR